MKKPLTLATETTGKCPKCRGVSAICRTCGGIRCLQTQCTYQYEPEGHRPGCRVLIRDRVLSILEKHKSDFCGCYDGDLGELFDDTKVKVTDEILVALGK